MLWHGTLLPLLLVVSGVLAVAVASFAWRERERTGAGVMAVVLLVIALWGIGQAVLLFATGLVPKRFGFDLSMVGYLSIPPLWLLYAVLYTGIGRQYVTRPLATAVAVVVGIAAVVFTNPVHSALYVDAGLQQAAAGPVFTYEWTTAYWVLVTISYLVVAVATALFARKFLASRNVYRKRTSFFIFASVTLTGCHVLSQYGLSPTPQFSLGPLYFLSIDVLSLLAFVSYRGMQFVPVNRVLGLFGGTSKALTPLARETVIEGMRGAVLVVDHKNRVVDINPEGRALLGDRDRVVGKQLRRLLPPEDFLTDDTDFLDPETTEGVYTGVWMQRDGETRCFDISLSALSTDDGTVAGRVALVHDVTERERRKRRLERKNEQLDDFASVVSHDLRNPLNVAKGSADLLAAGGDEQDIERLQDSLERMEAIIDDVLTLARQGQSVTETVPVSLSAAAENAWEHVDTPAATLDVAADTRIEADEGRLQQLFENLFRNAVEHGDGGVTVTVGVFEGGFYVADDGPGIPEDRREQVLEKGFTTSETGTGFGLAIVSSIAEGHGWEVTVTESAAGGARFEIRTHSETTGTDSVAPTV